MTLHYFISPIKKTVGTRIGMLEWLTLSCTVFLILVLIPVFSTPGNTLFFQLRIMPTWALFVLITLSILNALLILMQLYIKKETKHRKKASEHAKQGATAASIFLSALAATIACAACYSSIFAFLGLGATAFLVHWQVPIAILSIVITLFALYYSGRRINNNCEVCKLK